MIPSTVDRVPQQTAEHVNQRIRRQTEDRVEVLQIGLADQEHQLFVERLRKQLSG